MNTTPNFHFPQPAYRETGWTDEMNAFITYVDAELFALTQMWDDLQEADNQVGQFSIGVTQHILENTPPHAASSISETTDADVQSALTQIRSRLSALKVRVNTLAQTASPQGLP